jgi:hypothetical protein
MIFFNYMIYYRDQGRKTSVNHHNSFKSSFWAILILVLKVFLYKLVQKKENLVNPENLVFDSHSLSALIQILYGNIYFYWDISIKLSTFTFIIGFFIGIFSLFGWVFLIKSILKSSKKDAPITFSLIVFKSFPFFIYSYLMKSQPDLIQSLGMLFIIQSTLIYFLYKTNSS